MAPIRKGPSKVAKPRGRPAGGSSDKVAKRRGRPPGSRNSLPGSGRGTKSNAANAAPIQKRGSVAKATAQQSGAKRKRAGDGEHNGERSAAAEGKKRGRPARVSNAEVMEEEEDELSFAQAEAIPTVQGRKGRSSSTKKSGRPSRKQDVESLDRDANDASARDGKAHKYVQLAPRTRRIARETIETWPLVSRPVLDQMLETLRDAKKDIVNTQRDEQRAIAADETLGSMIRLLARQLSGSRVPPQAKEVHFNLDKLTERYAQLFGELTTARHWQQQLGQQAKVAQHLVEKDEERLEQLRKNARDWKTTWKQQERQGRMHPLLKGLEGEVMDDGPEDIGWKRCRGVDGSAVEGGDTELAAHLEQLRRSLESLQGNHEQVGGLEGGMRSAQVALDSVLFQHASAEQYAAL